MTTMIPPSPISPRFTLELEFVLCLSNPQYLSYLAVNYQNLLPQTTPHGEVDEDSDAQRFTRYLKYLYDYWRTPEYSKYLTHPGAVLRNLELLQQESFRRDIIQPSVIARLFEVGDDSKIVERGVVAPAAIDDEDGNEEVKGS